MSPVLLEGEQSAVAGTSGRAEKFQGPVGGTVVHHDHRDAGLVQHTVQ